MDWVPFYLSGKLALITTILLVTLSAPLSYVLTFSRFTGKSLCEALVNLPLVLPPTVLGFYLLIVMGPKGILGRIWEWLTHSPLIFSFAGIVFASLLYSLPFAIQPMKAAFTKIDRRLLENAYVLGLSPVSTFFRVVLPNSIGGVAASAILVFVHTLGEFGVILMVGGSIPGKTKVASIAIFEAVEALRYNDAWVMSLTLLPICYVVLLLVNVLSEKKRYGT
jgi:molybdate transport system permease protein